MTTQNLESIMNVRSVADVQSELDNLEQNRQKWLERMTAIELTVADNLDAKNDKLEKEYSSLQLHVRSSRTRVEALKTELEHATLKSKITEYQAAVADVMEANEAETAAKERVDALKTQLVACEQQLKNAASTRQMKSSRRSHLAKEIARTLNVADHAVDSILRNLP